jgi:hypothetical protein
MEWLKSKYQNRRDRVKFDKQSGVFTSSKYRSALDLRRGGGDQIAELILSRRNG